MIKYKKDSKFIWQFLSLFNRNVLTYSTTIGTTIYLSEKAEGLPEPEKTALIKHEETHVKQYEKESLLYCLNWLFNSQKRKQYELEAYREQFFYLRINGRILTQYEMEEWSRKVSTDYFPSNFINYGEALNWITKLF